MRLLRAGDMEIEVNTSCSKVGLVVKGEEHQSTQETFGPKLILPTKYTGIKMGQRLMEWTINFWPNLRPRPWECQLLTLLMIFYYALPVFIKASSSS